MIKKNIMLLIILIIFSCSNNNNELGSVFRYNEYSNISSLDPAFSSTLRNIWPCNQIFNGLVKMDENLNIIPDLAKKWTISDDQKTYNFTIKKDIFFHESDLFGTDKSRSVNAYDFEFSFNRLIDKNLASPGSWVMNNVKSFKALNDS